MYDQRVLENIIYFKTKHTNKNYNNSSLKHFNFTQKNYNLC